MRFPGHSPRHVAVPYVVRPPYGEARAALLSRRPAPDAGTAEGPFGRLFAVVADVGLEADLITVYLLADGTISIYSTAGIHSTGLRGAPRVADAAAAIVDEVKDTLAEFAPVDDIAALPLPDRGHAQVLVRTGEGDLAALDTATAGHGAAASIGSMALLLTQLARAALVEGFDRVEPGETAYRLAPEYRRIRSTLLDWIPEPERLAPDTMVAGVVVEVGDAATLTVTSLFAFADGSTSVYRSDGALAEGLSGRPGAAEAARALLVSVERALDAFAPAELIPLPQPGRVRFVARARRDGAAEWTELTASATTASLAAGEHPLRDAFDAANRVVRLVP